VEHVLATQCLRQSKPSSMEIRVNGTLPPGITAKDVILSIIGRIGVDGAVGHVIEYTGDVIRSLTMEGRMTVCNMSIEGGARAGMIAPDETTFEYMRGRPRAPQGVAFDQAVEKWRGLRSDPDARHDRLIEIEADDLLPHVTWGTNPGMVVPVSGRVPDPHEMASEQDQQAAEKALEYMARGIPVVASDVEPYRRFITHGVDGFLVKHEHEWLTALSTLAGDEALRLKMGAAGKEKARQNTIEGHYEDWVNAYKMLFPVGWEYKNAR